MEIVFCMRYLYLSTREIWQDAADFITVNIAIYRKRKRISIEIILDF